jgi:hypothetical protein
MGMAHREARNRKKVTSQNQGSWAAHTGKNGEGKRKEARRVRDFGSKRGFGVLKSFSVFLI